MKVQINTNTDGKSKHTEEARQVLISKLSFGFQSTNMFPEDPWSGELRAHFDPFGFTPGSWNNEGFGLIAGNKQWIREFKQGLRELGISRAGTQCLKYSVDERQGNDYVSLDATDAFHKSWLRLQKKIAKQHETDITVV